MSWELVNSTNVTKFEAGGGGDNYIPDGYIKSVEKVWLDTYTMAQVDTKATIDLAVLPANKKITSVEVTIETTAAQTSGTISIGFNSDAAVATLLGVVTLSHNLTATSIRLPGNAVSVGAVDGDAEVVGEKAFQKVTAGTQTTVALLLNNWTMSTGTIKSIVRYT